MKRLLFCLLLLSPLVSHSAPRLREWTFLIYSAGDEGVEERKGAFAKAGLFLLKEFEGIKALENNDDVAIALQYDMCGDDKDGVTHNKEWRRQITYHSGSSPQLQSRGISEGEIRKIDPSFTYNEQDSGSAVTLKKFITWGVKAFPAKHYFLIVQGHSWGKLGLLMDFSLEGVKKSIFPASMMTTYEFRRGIQEAYQELGKEYLPQGKIDGLLVDACVTANLDVLLEWKELFNYYVGPTIEIPFYSVPYKEVFGSFIKEISERRENDLSTGDADFIESKLLTPMVHLMVKSHVPGGQFVEKEGQQDIVHSVAVRMNKLPEVESQFTKFLSALPESSRKKLREGKEPSIWALRDSDLNVDLVQMSRTYSTLLSHDGKREAALAAAK